MANEDDDEQMMLLNFHAHMLVQQDDAFDSVSSVTVSNTPYSFGSTNCQKKN